MSWSHRFTGTPAEVHNEAYEKEDAIAATLPEFEKGDVRAAVLALESFTDVLPASAHVIVDLAGHGWRGAEDQGGGSMSINISYTLTTGEAA